MEFSIYEDALKTYLEAISPSATQKNNMDERYEDLAAVIVQSYPEASIYPQGSFATDTQVKPLTEHQGNGHAGGYDVDLAVERSWDGARESLKDVESAIEESGEYDSSDIDNTKSKCIRINFPEDATGVSFHLDIVPTKVIGDRHVPVREDDNWEHSNAKRFADWFNGEAGKNPRLRSLVVILKRLRDLNKLTDEVKSILLITLVVQNYSEDESLMADLVGLLDDIAQLLKNRPVIKNPVNPAEDLEVSYDELQRFFNDLSEGISEAAYAKNGKKLAEIFGPGFHFESEDENLTPSNPRPLASQPRAYGA